MPSRFRNASSKRISFFSFQDIITSVTGILILVTLMLTLYLNQAVGDRVGHADHQIREDLTTRIESLSRSNLAMIAQLNRLEAAPSAARLQAERGELEAAIQRLESSESRRVGALREQEADLVQTNRQLSASSDALKVRLEEMQKELSQKKAKTNAFFAIRGLPNSPKRPVISIVSGSSLQIERLGDAAGVHHIGDRNPVTDFKRFLASCDSSSNYVVFVVRPSGISRFYACREAATEAGFEVGYEPVAEDFDVRFQYEEGQ
ncbi:MAG TPA: hypothetical protein PLY00_18045 [Verrucomicrobiota bacterium]|jgi:predicted RNase H-like nuclease (RuvC/YqgF family)|nr:hypothetical protein [Verrucomicrobiota bacterium]OQC64148.1 MAG: hypothetical protein BWX48_02883 [Verrucomicrobia bacterium ADurb.Bin006]HOI37757.1 hypothetical protein [Bacillota bacterium]HOR73161.1 hypothetical protein [Verrucomicrobiota bacterium]HPW82626.1 hypothetical protein [Verrucomicrobiota bacterium]